MIGEMLNRTLLISILSLLLASAGAAQGIAWMTDIEQAQALSRETGRPLMFDFTAKWCGPCRRMDRDFWPKPNVVELSKQFVCVKVDFDLNKPFANKYGIKAIPNVVFTDPWGQGLAGQRGFGSGTETEILEKIGSLPKDFSSLKQAGDALARDEKNLDALHKFAQFYQERKYYWLGNEYYRQLLHIESDAAKRESILLNLAFNHIRMGEPGDAVERLEGLQKEYPKSPQNDLYLYGLVVARVKQKKLKDATMFVTELRRRFPTSTYTQHAEKAIGEEDRRSR